jgi:prepilin-type N-terminal cleavage/methylation domain-containing protein
MDRSQRNTTRRAFTLVELLVVIAVITALLGLLLPAVQSARESARRTQCLTNIRSLAQAVMTYETARNRLPAVTDRTPSTATIAKAGTPGTANGAGYSWIFHMLPYLEDTATYDTVSNNTGKLVQGPFSVGTTAGAAGGGAWTGDNCTGELAPTVSGLTYLACPSSAAGTRIVTDAAPPDGQTAATDYGAYAAANGPLGRTNYVAMAGAYVDPTTGPVGGAFGGAIQFRPSSSAGGSTGLAGSSASTVSDGLGKTILAIESREKAYASWIDGQTCWVTALPGSFTFASGSSFQNNRWQVASTALNEENFLTPGQFQGIGADRTWGPSSEHAGVVVTAFGDTHVQVVAGDVDPSVFVAWSTKGGNESNGTVTP